MPYRPPEWSYERHVAHEETHSDRLPSLYVNPKSVDAWLHTRMLDTLLPLIQAFPSASWMTIGDGKYGSDAWYLEQHGADVTATSLWSGTLRVAHERGYIKKYMAENAEQMASPTDSYDFVLCKASYHHFPRPPLAFYEMLRTARKAVILIEPIEGVRRPLDFAKQVIKRVIRGDATSEFEISGNFLYRASVREVEKMMTALGGVAVAVKKFNDFSHPKLAIQENTWHSFGALGTRAGLLVQDCWCRLGLMNYGLATIMAFKIEPGEQLRRSLMQAGFRVKPLPINPYVSAPTHTAPSAPPA
jgi:hypothetical protein